MACDLADLGSPTDMVDGSGKGSRRVPVANLPLITIQALLCFPPPGASLLLLVYKLHLL